MAFSTISTINQMMLIKKSNSIGIGKYPIHALAGLTMIGTNYTSETLPGGFKKYTITSNNNTYAEAVALGSNNTYFNNKSFTLYFSYTINEFLSNSSIIGFGPTNNNNGYLWHINMITNGTLAFDWQIAGIQYGYNSGNNSNSPTWPYAIGSQYHLFMVFDKPTQKYDFTVYNNNGTVIHNYNKSYPANLFGSGHAKEFIHFTFGNNNFAWGSYSAKQTIHFFNLYDKKLTDVEMLGIIG